LFVFDGSTGEIVITVPLPVDTFPMATALSQDGRRLYVANRPLSRDTGSASLTVVDTSTFAILGHYTLPRQAVGSTPAWVSALVTRMATRPDDTRVYLIFGDPTGFAPVVEAFDTTSHQIVAANVLDNGTYGVAFSSKSGMVYVLSGSPVTGGPNTHVSMFDGSSLAFVSERAWSGVSPLTVSSSSDGKRLVLMQFVARRGASTTISSLLDPVSLGDLKTFPAPMTSGIFASAPQAGALEIASTGEVISAFEPLVQRVNMMTGAVTRSPSLPGVGEGLAVTPDERRAFVITHDKSRSIVDLASGLVTGTRPLPGSGPAAATPAGAASCTYRLDSMYRSWKRDGGVGQVRLTTGCAWSAGASSAGWVHLLGPASGQGNATFNVVVDEYSPPPFPPFGKRNATVTIAGQVLTVTQAGADTQPSFGLIDTPSDNTAGITGSLPVTGWALDDVGVARVRIFRDAVAGEPAGQVYLGDATFVDGARPDVQAVYPSQPFASRAGWGYLLLTNMLPAGGTGTYRLYAYADDIEGRTTLLGSRTIACANSTAISPFGAIDTPGQGEVVSGTITNWGWALTPRPASILADGSTIDVVVDGAVVGHPVYNLNRQDVAALFPGYANTNGAVGYFTIDTTALPNGLHTLAWVVRDNAGHVTGVGSRYFMVANP
jgi:hypothetical protein